MAAFAELPVQLTARKVGSYQLPLVLFLTIAHFSDVIYPDFHVVHTLEVDLSGLDHKVEKKRNHTKGHDYWIVSCTAVIFLDEENKTLRAAH